MWGGGEGGSDKPFLLQKKARSFKGSTFFENEKHIAGLILLLRVIL